MYFATVNHASATVVWTVAELQKNEGKFCGSAKKSNCLLTWPPFVGSYQKQNKTTSASEAVERWGTLVYCWWKCKVVQLLWKAERGYLKIENRITTWSSNHSSGYIPKRIKSRTLKRYLYPHVHSSIVYSSQGVEPSKCPPAGEWISNMLYMPTQWNITQPSKGRAFW